MPSFAVVRSRRPRSLFHPFAFNDLDLPTRIENDIRRADCRACRPEPVKAGMGSSERVLSRMIGLRTNEGVSLACRGGGAGPPLLLVHGTATDSSQWQPVRPILESHFTVHAVDRRGYGLSGDGPGYRIE